MGDPDRQRCGGCGRPIHEDRVACLYCGWSKVPESDESGTAHPPPSPLEPRTFRPGATTGSFLLWSLTAAAGAAASWSHSERPAFRLLAAALLLLGPLAFIAHLVRMAVVKVIVHPVEGLLLSGGRRVAWEEIERVEYHGARAIPDYALARILMDLLRSLSGMLAGGIHGMAWLLLLLLLIGVACLLPLAAFASGVLFPVFVLLSPWQPRVAIFLKDGGRLAWRDLRHEADFVHLVERGLSGRLLP
ncbi:MAG TPA: hypothetical protein VJB14_08300 [Planctomycetota bacterium]|nr:hypothetical protein [Planctomycetota bacterium]